MTGLDLSGLSFGVPGRAIVSGASLSVERGETVAILGPSGSGKTTLLRLVAGLERPSSGSVAFDGENLSSTPPHRRGFGMMFQDHALFPHMDVAGNVEFGLKQFAWNREARITRRSEVLDIVGLQGFERRAIDKLSGGERQRVALARALAPKPKLLMLDEPLGSLDRGLRERLAQDLREILSKLGITALYVTHDQAEAFTVADRLAIMDAGRIIRVGSAREVWSDPQTEFVARFLGLTNIVPGTTDADGFVQTQFGAFRPVAGAALSTSFLLRTEGAELTSGPGLNIASGTVGRILFQGANSEVGLSSGGAQLTFNVPTDQQLPPAGTTAHFAVSTVQALRSETISEAGLAALG